MIKQVIDTIQSQITTLPFVERFGGLVIPVSREVNTSGGFPSLQTFPVTCSVTGADCWEGEKYLDLVPDSRYLSVFYFERRGDLRMIGCEGPKSNQVRMSGTVRLVGWLNLMALGYTECSITHMITPVIIDALLGDYNTASPLVNGKVMVKSAREIEKSERIFSAYNYGFDIQKFLLYPYDYLAIDFEFELIFNRACLDAFSLGDPVDCIDLTAE